MSCFREPAEHPSWEAGQSPPLKRILILYPHITCWSCQAPAGAHGSAIAQAANTSSVHYIQPAHRHLPASGFSENVNLLHTFKNRGNITQLPEFPPSAENTNPGVGGHRAHVPAWRRLAVAGASADYAQGASACLSFRARCFQFPGSPPLLSALNLVHVAHVRHLPHLVGVVTLPTLPRWTQTRFLVPFG